MSETKRYYYCEDGETPVGPFSREKFQELLAKEVVTWEVWVVREDDSEWRAAADYEEFKDFEALVASGRAGQNYQSVLDAAFVSTVEDEKRAQDLQTLQRASARIDLMRFREEATDREEVPTGEKPSAFWWLRYLQMKPVIIGLGFAACLGLVFLVTHGLGKKKPDAEAPEKPSQAVSSPSAGNGSLGSLPTLGSGSSRPDINVPEKVADPDGEKLANSRLDVRESPAKPADFYQLSRAFSVRVDNENVSLRPGQRVKVIDRQPDMWTVEAGDVRFQVSPTDLRRENVESVSTVGTPAVAEPAPPTGDMAIDGAGYEQGTPAPRSAGSGVPAAAIPRFGE
jgi:hypothetical protein